MTTERVQTINGGVATIFVKDMSRAVQFYTETLGLKLVYRADDHWASIDAGSGFMLGLHPAANDRGDCPTPGVQGGVQIGFNVPGRIEESVAALESRGVAFPKGVHEDAGGSVKLAFFQDPDGNEHYLCEVGH